MHRTRRVLCLQGHLRAKEVPVTGESPIFASDGPIQSLYGLSQSRCRRHKITSLDITLGSLISLPETEDYSLTVQV